VAARDDRNTWTDDRLDDLAQRVDTGFKELRADMRAQGVEINQRFAAQDEKMDRMFESLHGDMMSMHGDMTSMRGDMTSMRGDMTSMRGEMMSMQRDMISIHRTMLIGMATILASTVGAVVGSNVLLG